MVDPFRADAEMLQDCWFTSDSRDMKPSPVVLHDRLMTDAALGSLPIKNEHSYSIESDGDSGPSSPVTAVDGELTYFQYNKCIARCNTITSTR